MTSGPDDAFFRLVAPHEGALRVHCYRMLGSSHDSDDVLQETLVRAWRAKESLASASAVRPWLYRIATNTCLDELKNRKQRPLPSDVVPPAADPTAPPAPPTGEVDWLEPCPDAWLAGLSRDPAATYELKESVALAFVAALQCLSPPQRAVLLLRDVLGMPADETATALDMTVSAANSALHRARTALRERVAGREEELAAAVAEVDEELLARYVRAWEELDLPALVALLHDDVTATMPPSPTWLRGKAATTAFLAARPFARLVTTPPRVLPIHANGQPAFGFYVAGVLHAVHVLGVREGRIVALYHFSGESLVAFRGPRYAPRT
jgi:RNA polymerase sigma-70 factor (ECF subfamily)